MVVEPPALAEITGLFPDWDLVQIVEYAHLGKKPLQKEQRNTRASKTTQKANEKQREKENRACINEDFYSEREIDSMLKTMVEKLKKYLGFEDIDMQKLYKTLEKHGMDVKRSVVLIKKNLPFYRTYFKIMSEEQ